MSSGISVRLTFKDSYLEQSLRETIHYKTDHLFKVKISKNMLYTHVVMTSVSALYHGYVIIGVCTDTNVIYQRVLEK